MTSRNIEPKFSGSDKQRELFESDARFRVGMMGRRSGKNEVSTAAEMDYAVRPGRYTFGTDDASEVVVWHVAPTYRQAYLYGYLKTKEKLPDALLDRDNTRGSEWGPSKITLNTGAEIEYLSYGNRSGLQGGGVDLLVGDEWAYSDPNIWHEDLRPMLLDHGGGTILISKPLGENHFYDMYVYGASEGQIYGDGTPRRDEWYSVHGTGYDESVDWIDADELDTLKETTPESIFRQEYLADPTSGGTLLTLDMLESEPASVLDGQQWEWHVSVDLGVEMSAKKARENDTDYWALAIIAEHPRHAQAYLCEVRRRRGQAPSQAAQWINDCLEWVPTNRVKYEKVQAQSWFETHLQDEGLTPIPHTPTASKEDRIIGLSVPFSNGQVKLLDWSDVRGKDMDWSDFRTEWAGFPGGKVDQLDAVAQGLDDVTFGVNATGSGLDIYGRDIDE